MQKFNLSDVQRTQNAHILRTCCSGGLIKSRTKFISQGDWRLEFQEVTYNSFASYFWLFLFLFASFLMHKAFVYVLSLSSMLSSAPLNRQRIKRTCPSAVYFFFHVKFIKKNIVETRLKPRKSIITLFWRKNFR